MYLGFGAAPTLPPRGEVNFWSLDLKSAGSSPGVPQIFFLSNVRLVSVGVTFRNACPVLTLFLGGLVFIH